MIDAEQVKAAIAEAVADERRLCEQELARYENFLERAVLRGLFVLVDAFAVERVERVEHRGAEVGDLRIVGIELDVGAPDEPATDEPHP